MTDTPQRERLGSRLGFIFISAGCAIGLGNVWRFPFITGSYGGAAFVLMYLFFLLCFALPIMVMEFSVGRASRLNIAGSFKKLEPKGAKWHYFGFIGIAGNYLLMMFYTTVAGWMLAYCWFMATDNLANLQAEEIAPYFSTFLQSPGEMVFWMALAVAIGFGICARGLQKGVERITTWMMSGLFLLILVLVVRSVTLPGAGAGIEFYLKPDFSIIKEKGVWTCVYAAMGQAFFTLSIGIGSMAIFGSYISRERSLTGESINIMLLDTAVAVLAGLIIFPACFAFNVAPEAGPSLLFITLPNVFRSMPGGTFWGVLFFIFMSFAALSTVIAVFENIVAYGIDVLQWSRRKACAVNAVIMFFASLPCVLGFNLWAGFQPLGKGTNVLDLEDFIVSNNLLPLGALVYLLFCTTRYGWGWDKFIAEADAGKGLKFPRLLRPYVSYVIPAAMIVIFIQGYIDKFKLFQ